MATNWLFGALKLSDADRVYINTVGQRVVWDAVQQYIDSYRAYAASVSGVFVAGTTSDHTMRFKLPGGGTLQRRGLQTQAGAVKAAGAWDVGLPLEDFGAQVAADDVAMAYMTVDEVQRHIDTVVVQDLNTRRQEILRALLNNTARTFVDPLRGSITVQPLANGDTVEYPPVAGATAIATDDHYLETNYASASISDTNNPFVTIRDELEEHFGTTQGGSNIVSFINPAQASIISDLTDFDEVDDRFVRPGANTDTVTNLPAGLPGRVIGRVSGVWIAEWRWLPANYIVATDLDSLPPLMERVDPADTGLGMGLQLVSQDATYPFMASHWRDRFGYGVANRLNGIVLELGTGGSYSIPSGYS